MPKKSDRGQGQMRRADRERNQVRIEGMPGVFAEELRVGREQSRIQDLQNAGKVDLRVFGIGMIAMDKKGEDGQEQQAGVVFNFQKESLPRLRN